MNTTFTVAITLNAVNNMTPGILTAIRQVGQLRDSVGSVNNMQPSGVPSTGYVLDTSIKNLINKASDRQVAQLKLKEAGIGLTDISDITNKAKELSKELMFGVNELLTIPLAMQRAGMDADKIKNSFQQIAYVTQLEHVRTGRGTYDIAKDLSSMSELAKVTGDQNQLKSFMESVNRVATVTGANTGALAESSKSFLPVASMYGINSQDAMFAQGTMARFGIEGSMAGIQLKDFVEHLNPYEFLNRSGESQQIEAMHQMGFLQNAQFQTLGSGQPKFTDVGESSFFSEGKIKPIMDVFTTLGDKYKEMLANDPEHGAQKFAAAMKHIFGEQGKDIAIIAAQNVEQIHKMKADFERVQSVEQSVKDFQQTYKQTLGAFMTKLEEIGTEAVTQLMVDLTAGMKAIGPYLDSIGKWAESHKEIVNGIVRVVVSLVAMLKFLRAVESVGEAIGTLLATGFSVLSASVRGAILVVTRLRGLLDGFKYFRLLGAGFFEALWKGAQFAFPWLMRISGWVRAFGGQWLLTAIRIAAGWLIALGPAGWIFLAVSAFVVAAIAAWEENFMGFRDKVKEIWSTVSGFIQGAIQTVSNFIDKCMEAVGLGKKVKEAMDQGSYQTPGGVADQLPEADVPWVPQPRNSANVNVTQTFNIQSTEPRAVADEVAKRSNDEKYTWAANGREPIFEY